MLLTAVYLGYYTIALMRVNIVARIPLIPLPVAKCRDPDTLPTYNHTEYAIYMIVGLSL